MTSYMTYKTQAASVFLPLVIPQTCREEVLTVGHTIPLGKSTRPYENLYEDLQ